MGFTPGVKVEVERGGVKAALIVASRRKLPLARLAHLSNGYRVLAAISAEDLLDLLEKMG